MAVYRLEFDEQGEPVLVEECNGTARTPVREQVERYLTGVNDTCAPTSAMLEPDHS